MQNELERIFKARQEHLKTIVTKEDKSQQQQNSQNGNGSNGNNGNSENQKNYSLYFLCYIHKYQTSLICPFLYIKNQYDVLNQRQFIKQLPRQWAQSPRQQLISNEGKLLQGGIYEANETYGLGPLFSQSLQSTLLAVKRGYIELIRQLHCSVVDLTLIAALIVNANCIFYVFNTIRQESQYSFEMLIGFNVLKYIHNYLYKMQKLQLNALQSLVLEFGGATGTNNTGGSSGTAGNQNQQNAQNNGMQQFQQQIKSKIYNVFDTLSEEDQMKFEKAQTNIAKYLIQDIANFLDDLTLEQKEFNFHSPNIANKMTEAIGKEISQFCTQLVEKKRNQPRDLQQRIIIILIIHNLPATTLALQLGDTAGQDQQNLKSKKDDKEKYDAREQLITENFNIFLLYLQL